MPRLQYSSNGIVRAVEMSRCAVTAFVEGYLDRAFFGALLNENPTANTKTIEIRLAHELHASMGNGKTALLALHTKLKQNARLMFTLGMDKKAILVFLDKDIDDLRRTRRRCQHVIYTETYGVENYLFRHGDLVKTLSCGGCLDCQSVGMLPTNQQWTQRAAQSWNEWMAFCIMTARFKTLGLPNFGAKSLLHTGPYGALDATKEATLLSSVSSKTARPLPSVKAAYARELIRVKAVLAADMFDEIFNGKWYSAFLAADARRLAAGRQLPVGLEERLESALMSSLDFRASWTNPLQQKVNAVLSAL